MELFMNTRDVVYSPKRQDLYERNRYSPAIRSNGFLFVSGQVGSLDDGSPQEGLTAQVRQAFENLNNILAAAGSSFAEDRKSTRLNSSHVAISYAVFSLKKKII